MPDIVWNTLADIDNCEVICKRENTVKREDESAS